MPQAQKYERFQVYNANLAKNPAQTTEYPRMLTSPEDRHTTVVQDAEEHEALVGPDKFKTAPLWGPSKDAPPSSVELRLAPEVPSADSSQANDIVVPEASRKRQGARAQSLDGKAATVNELVPAQTVFDVPPPNPEAKIRTNLLPPKTQA